MTTRILMTLKAMDPKTLALLALGPAVITIAGDAALAHFAGREMHNPAQLLPVIVGPIAGAVVLLGVGAKAKRTASRLVRGAGAALVVLGTIGTGFHARALLRLLTGQRLAWDVLANALAAAPPLFAPGAFLGLGALLWVLGNPAVVIRLERPAVAAARLAALDGPAANDGPARAA